MANLQTSKKDSAATEEHMLDDTILNRLKRIEGQVRGIQKMVVSERDCESVVIQLAAVRSAIDSVGALILRNYMKFCFRRGGRTEPASVDSLARAISVWGRVRLGED